MLPFKGPSTVLLLAALTTPSLAFFKILCDNPLIRERADPIVSPGKISGHTHTISGGGNFNPNMTYDHARQGTCSSCIAKADLSNYWTPQLYFQWANGSFSSVDQVGGTTIYYLYRQHASDKTGLTAFPAGFKMLAGNPFLRTYNASSLAQQAVSHVCVGVTGPQTPNIPSMDCPDGYRPQVRFPSCWTGKSVFEADGSHVAYSDGESGPCPPTHTVRLPTIFYEVMYSVTQWVPYKSQAKNPAQPFVYAMGDPYGYGFHGDFFNGWDVPKLQSALDNCLDPGGDITQCSELELFDRSVDGECHRTPDVDEIVLGTLDKLPGCNPVTTTQADALAASSTCPGLKLPKTWSNAVSYTGGAPPPGAHVLPNQPTVKLSYGKWKYLDCYSDVSNPRPFPNGLTTTKRDVEACLIAAEAGGYKYVGLEYGGECWAGNTIPSSTSIIGYGKCDMACDDVSTRYCGGPNALDLYEYTAVAEKRRVEDDLPKRAEIKHVQMSH